MSDYKNEIEQTRVGCLGSSDATLLQQVANLGYVPQSAHERLAIVKGLVGNKNITTEAMRYGDYIEQSIYAHISATNPNFESNPLWVSTEYSKPNCKLIAHPDFVWVDKENKTLNVYECKATRYTIDATKGTYRAQMFIEYLLALELYRKTNKVQRVNIFLCHYNTNGLDLSETPEFDPKRLSIHRMNLSRYFFNVDGAMNTINEFLETFNEYYAGEEIESEYLPVNVRQEFDMVTLALQEIKEREQQIEDFKSKLYAFMREKNIKSIKNESWSVTRVDESETKQFDSKRYVEYLRTKYPRKAQRIIDDYTKTIKRKGCVQIRLKNKNNND